MRIFVYEHVCGGGCAEQPLSPRWIREGWAMLSAVAADLAEVEGVEVCCSLDARLQPRALAAHRVREVFSAQEQRRVFLEEGSRGAAVLVIAPEIDGLLYDLCAQVERAGGRLLGPSSEAVKQTADKFALNGHLADRGVRVPRTWLVDLDHPAPADFPFPAVHKPRFGAGSENVLLVAAPDSGIFSNGHAARAYGAPSAALAARVGQGQAPANAAGRRADTVLEQYVAGDPVSVSFLVGERSLYPLLPGRQRLTEDGHFHYLGGCLPLPVAQQRAVIEQARQAIAAVPGLRGYVGVDLVLRHAGLADHFPHAHEATVIEINPRLTTSYVGLRPLACGNLADWMLQVLQGESPPIEWQPGVVEFDADGTVREVCAAPRAHEHDTLEAHGPRPVGL